MWQVVGVLFLSPTAHTHAHTHPLQVVEVLFLSPTAHTHYTQYMHALP